MTYDVSFCPPAEGTCALPSNIGLPDERPPPEDTPLWLFVSVNDTGPGLGPNELALLFKRFSQGNAMIHTRYGGSGLGLFICKKISELLGGHIEVLSTVGEGSTFQFYIQARAVAPPTLDSLVSAASSVSLDASASGLSRPTYMNPTPSSASGISSIILSKSPPPQGMAPLHILIVEDNIINQTVLKRQIIKAGLSCDGA